MSNLIKSHYINLRPDSKMVGIGNGFQSLADSAPELVVEEEALDGFSNGLDVVTMQRLVEEEEELIAKKADRLLVEANEAAMDIIEDAKKEAETIRLHAMEEGKKAGYLEGFGQGQAELHSLEQKLQEQKNTLEAEFDRKAANLEPKFATVVAKLLEKLTGIMAEEHKDIILHLIHQGMSEVEKSKHFVIKVSSEEYRTVLEHKGKIEQGLPDDVELYIKEEEEFAINQCLIEADGKMIDCSLDVQMKSLITDLKLLACI